MAPCINDERLQQIKSERKHCTVIGRPDVSDLSYVDVDNSELVATMTERLLGKYDKVFLINSLHNMTISEDRRQGFLKACEKHGVEGDKFILESSNGSEEIGYWIAKSIVEKDVAVITANGRTARGVYRVINEKGLKVGTDVGVFALGKSQQQAPFEPSLSYATQDYFLLGATAVDILVEEIEKDVERTSVLVKSGIVEGQSTQR